jgi:serine/threonine protein kinase
MSKLLSQGGFGCVYYPGIRCANKKDDENVGDDMGKYVSKLQRANFNSINEANIGLRVKQNSLYKYFFLPVVSECPVKMASFSKTNEDLVSKCEVIKDIDKAYTLMKIPYANNKPIIEEIFDDVRNKKHVVVSMLESYTHLLKGVQIMIDMDVVHFDLKSDNVLYDSDMNHANIIDFGLSIPIDKLPNKNYDDKKYYELMKEYFYLYAPEYYVWPIEVHVINYLLHELEEGEDVSGIAERIAEEYVATNKGLQMFSKSFVDDFREACNRRVLDALDVARSDSLATRKRGIIDGLIKSYDTWDNYAISIIYLRYVHLLFASGFPENQFYIQFSQLLLRNIHPDPTMRFSIADTRQRLYELFYLNEDADTYIKMIEDIELDLRDVKTIISTDMETLNSRIEKSDT